jgi:hypothetical protein
LRTRDDEVAHLVKICHPFRNGSIIRHFSLRLQVLRLARRRWPVQSDTDDVPQSAVICRYRLTPGPSSLTVPISQKGDSMAQGKPTFRAILSRSIAVLILVGIYCFSIVGASVLLVGASTTSAFARGGGGRGGGGRGGGGRGGGARGFGRGGGVVVRGGRGRGYGRGIGYVTPGCYWRYGVRVCPYY